MIQLSKIVRANHSALATKLNHYPQFTLRTNKYSQDYGINLEIHEHNNTGAYVYHIQNNDSNNAFAVIAQTLPENNKGCPHILEHIACCGSVKYPVRDPFFKMLRRSVSSYMNAWTGDDFTCYPFSSPNTYDWKNLYNVYLDMSLRPLLNELDFRQEGWRYEMDSNGHKQLKGIVLNEMKGAYQNSQRQLFIALNQNLFNNTPYAYDSGGYPPDIVKLEYQELKNMHRKYYHPSNLAFYFYGDAAIHNNLQYLNKQYLSHYQKKAFQKINLTPTIKHKYQTIESNTIDKNSMCLGFYLGQMDQISEVDKLCLRIISYILLQTNQSQLYKEYIESGIADNIGMSGINVAKLTSFTLTLKGVNKDYKLIDLENSFINNLKRLCQQQLPKKRVDQFIHQYQIDILLPKKNNGLRILQNAINIFNHRADTDFIINPRKYIKEAQQKLTTHLQSILDKYFINNQHRCLIIQVKAENKVDNQILEGLQMNQQKIKAQQQQLQEWQKRTEDQNILPMLRIQDLNQKTIKPFEIVNKLINNGRQIVHYFIPIDQNISYFRIVFTLENVNQEFLNSIDLWKYTLNKGIGTTKHNYKQFSSLLSLSSANFNVSTCLSQNQSVNVVFSAVCLPQNKQKLLNLLNQLINQPKFQPQNIQNLFKSYVSDVNQTLKDSPINQCLDLCSSTLSKKGYLFNKFDQMMNGSLLARKKQFKSLSKIFQYLYQAKNIKFIQHSKKPSSQIIQLNNFQNLVRQPSNLNLKFDYASLAVTYNYDVSFCTQQYIGPQNLSEDHANISLALKIMEQQYLHPQIRQKGGAYGAKANIRENGLITLYSYMDPLPQNSFKVFSESVAKLLQKKSINEQTLNEAKISRFAEIDKPLPPQNQSLDIIIKDISLKKYKSYKQFIKKSNFNDILSSSLKYLSKPCSKVLFSKDSLLGFTQRKLQLKQMEENK